MCRDHEFEYHVYIDWFLKLFHFPKYIEYELQVALKYHLIYPQSGYVYIICLDLPRPGDANALREFHVKDGIFGSISHPPPLPYALPPMSYGQHQGGTSSSYTYPPCNP